MVVKQRFLEIFLFPQVVWRPSSSLAEDGAIHSSTAVAACQGDEQEAGQPLRTAGVSIMASSGLAAGGLQSTEGSSYLLPNLLTCTWRGRM